MPLQDIPEVFGLHSNADISYQVSSFSFHNYSEELQGKRNDIKCITLYLEMQNTILSSLQINTAKGILDTILSVQPKESSGGKPGETREAIVYKIAEDMLRKLPRDYVPHEIKEALIRLGGLLPMNIFLRQEIDRMQKILSIGKHTYCNLI